ncbi:circadian clock protein KaiB [Acuticoccus sp. I52.16.1]|uniref:circadian clock protein KaiB n=1 Tax=Acuticoccus sp. I52.16.1 TaxID=2928472 RepID=UPI001FD208FA|nr:circadian clock protein KaiB [Acuticoccus sp. I52.16.1]UOM34760.1 circadian clock protein KaiB [Acuticoccus sp. I52.16.1]
MRYRLRLYITGRTPYSQRAIANLHEICDRELKGRCDVEIIDVLEDPSAAEEDRILATPTLVRKLPEPVRKIIGDLSDREKVYIGLDVSPIDISVSGE